MLLKHGRIIDPASSLDRVCDLRISGDRIAAVGFDLLPDSSEHVIDCTGLVVMPGLIDMHLHLGDLFDINDSPVNKAACDGVTLGLSPGAGNTYMAPALLGAEIDRGAPVNMGVYLGAAAVLGASLSEAEIIRLFRHELDEDTKFQKLSRNSIVNATAHLAVGIKDHMGHFILSDDHIKEIFAITSEAGLIFMSHTQDPAHAERLVRLSGGRPLHLGHATATGCGTHDDGLAGFRRVLALIDGKTVTGEFVSSMLLPCRGRRDGLLIDERARQAALQALADHQVSIMVSDGQSGATMKGFGNTADNLPAIFYLAEQGVLSLSDSVALMTANPAALLAERTGQKLFREQFGTLAQGAFANITIADPLSGRASCTIVNGQTAAFDGCLIRKGAASGRWIHHLGVTENLSVGDLPLYRQ